MKNPIAFDTHSSMHSVAARIMEFIGVPESDWKVIIAAPIRDLEVIINFLQFNAPNFLALSRTGRTLRSRYGTIFGASTIDLVQGHAAERLLFIVKSDLLNSILLDIARASSTETPVLWLKD